jgi:type II secretory pathway predicted ATPase ExeA
MAACPDQLTPAQLAALAKVGCGIESGDGVAVLCGPSGVGKTSVLLQLADEVRRHGRSIAIRSVAAWLDPSLPLTDVVAADDAHLASEDDLAALLARCRSRAAGGPLVLAGEGRLLTLLNRDPGLARAVRIRAALLPGSLADTGSLLAAIGGRSDSPPFGESAIAAIHAIAAGVPADVVRLAELAGVLAAARPDRPITAADIEALHRRLSPLAA